MTFIFLHTCHLKFTISTNIIYTLFETTFGMSIVALIAAVNIFNSWSIVHLLCPDVSDPSNLTECTSDNKCLRSFNDTTSVAKHFTLKTQLG